MKTPNPKKEKKEKVVPLPNLLKKAQIVFNTWIRNRDAGKPCISCGGYHTLQAGHYIAVGQNTFLRFDERNVHGQCGGCNGPKGGNVVPYRIELRKRLGDFDLEQLEKDFIENRTFKWSREELNEIIRKYSLPK